MKKVRVILSIMALVLAIGGTFATQYKPADSITAFEYIPGPPVICSDMTTSCSLNSAIVCTINNHEVRANNSTSSSCGAQLKHP